MARVFRGILLVAGILALTAGSANAQAIGSIFGKVTDQSGGVLPGVTRGKVRLYSLRSPGLVPTSL